jgi:coenzyme Q-binding protein COQ10
MRQIVRGTTDVDEAHTRSWQREFPRFKPEQLFALVADIESYPIFMPGCLDARIVEKGEEVWRVENVFGFGPVQRRFISIAELKPPDRLDISSRDGPWRDFRMSWQFQPSGAGCRVSCTSTSRFRSPVLAALARFSESAMEERIIAAFEARAEVLFGGNHRRQ